jgi:hypothetical protein
MALPETVYIGYGADDYDRARQAMFNEGLPSSFSCTAPSIETANGVLHPLIKIQDTTECTFPPYTVDLDLDDTQRTFRIRPTGGLLVATPEYIPAYAGGLVPKDTACNQVIL